MHPPIIAVHGWQDNANTFDGLVPLMSSNLSVLSIDLPGHGFSSNYPEGFPYHRMTAIMALRRVIDHYGWETVSLLGHSLGGQTCFLFTAMYSEQVKSLAMLDILAPIPQNAKTFIKKGGSTIDDFMKRDKQKMETSPTYTYEAMTKMVVNSPIAPVSEEAAKILLERGSMMTEDGKYRFNRDPKVKGPPLAGWPARDLLAFCLEVKSNVLCIKAESSSYYSTKEFFDECWTNVSKAAISADLRFVPGGHHVHLQSPDVVAPILNEFFDKYY